MVVLHNPSICSNFSGFCIQPLLLVRVVCDLNVQQRIRVATKAHEMKRSNHNTWAAKNYFKDSKLITFRIVPGSDNLRPYIRKGNDKTIEVNFL